jgi:Cu(I)/Ag(I) efflux system membrane fusion protein
VITTGERTVVIVANPDGTFAPTNVSAGTEQDGLTVILKGLAEGQSIVASGQFLIDSEASLKSAISRLEGSAPMSMEKTP